MHNQLIVLIIFAVIAGINYLIRQSGTTRPLGRGSPPATPLRPRQTPTGQSGDDERLRKFMDALGVPADAVPPPRKITRPQPPFVPRVQPVPVRRPAPRQAYTPPPIAPAQPAYQAETVGLQAAARAEYDVAIHPSAAIPGVVPAGVAATSAAVDLGLLLRSSSSIRAAMVLKEILGTPKGLQSMDVIPGLR